MDIKGVYGDNTRLCALAQRLHERLSAVGALRSDCLLLGSAALAARCIRDVRDLDVLATPRVIESLRKHATDSLENKLAFVIPNLTHWDDKDLGVCTIEMSDRLVDFAPKVESEFDLVRRADTWQGWRVISLQDLCEIKRAMGREKDLADLASIACYYAEGKA